MFQKIIQLSIKNKVTIGMLTLVLIIWGTWSLSQLPFDSTPDITNNQVQVITQAPSLGAQEVEQFITTPVEMALANIPVVHWHLVKKSMWIADSYFISLWTK